MRSSLFTGVTALAGLVAGAPLARRAALTQVTDFGDNPTNTGMYIYVPSTLASSRPSSSPSTTAPAPRRPTTL
ncbi:hypothetical protein LTR53_011366, partial [Teratosphaeriaceae sp. CCFEE 6253]